MALAVGTKAPDFTLKTKTADGLQEVTLSDQYGKGKTVLLFFPLAFTGVCIKELCSVRDSLADYNNLGATVFAISVDSPFTQEIFAQQNNLNFTLLSDFNKEVSSSYDVLFEDLIGLKGVSKRSAFVIDSNGDILFSSSSDDPTVLPDFEAIKAALS
ncbi:MAG: redoxin domain-containing protein [Verrucomicrobiae bacterium]|nr:redoxin domain-containing protein [Verrucomicrobiae bacterium]